MRLHKHVLYAFLSIVLVCSALTFEPKKAEAFIVENHWADGITVYCYYDSNCYNGYFYWANAPLRASKACDGAANGCGGGKGAFLTMTVPNDNLFCKEIHIGKVNPRGRVKIFYGQALVYADEDDTYTNDIRRLDTPGFLCK